MRKGRAQGKKPNANGIGTFAVPDPPPDYDNRSPVFCLHHLAPGFDVETLDSPGRAAFAVALAKRAQLKWTDIAKSGRHALGTEWIKAEQIRATIPANFEDCAKFMVFRYDGKKPMVGVRVKDVFHVLWIEPNFGDLYDHGS